MTPGLQITSQPTIVMGFQPQSKHRLRAMHKGAASPRQIDVCRSHTAIDSYGTGLAEKPCSRYQPASYTHSSASKHGLKVQGEVDHSECYLVTGRLVVPVERNWKQGRRSSAIDISTCSVRSCAFSILRLRTIRTFTKASSPVRVYSFGMAKRIHG